MIEAYKQAYPDRSIEDFFRELLTSTGFKSSKISVTPFQVTKSLSGVHFYGNTRPSSVVRSYIYLAGNVDFEDAVPNDFGASNSIAKYEYFFGDIDVSYGWQDNFGSFSAGDDVTGYFQTLWMMVQKTPIPGQHIERLIGMNVNQSVCKEAGLNFGEPVSLRNKLFSGLRLNSGARNPDLRSANGAVAFLYFDFSGYKISVR